MPSYQVIITRPDGLVPVPIETFDIDALTPAHAKMLAHAWRKVADLREPGDTYDVYESTSLDDEVALVVLQAQVRARYCPDTWHDFDAAFEAQKAAV